MTYQPTTIRKSMQKAGRIGVDTPTALVGLRPEPASGLDHTATIDLRGPDDLDLVEAIMLAATNAIYVASRGALRETRAGYDLFKAIHDLTGSDGDHEIMLQVGAFAGVVPTEEL